MLKLDSDDFLEKDTMVQAFADAISPFSGHHIIGENDKDEPVELKNSLQFVIQPKGQGKRAKLANEEVFAELGWE